MTSIGRTDASNRVNVDDQKTHQGLKRGKRHDFYRVHGHLKACKRS